MESRLKPLTNVVSWSMPAGLAMSDMLLKQPGVEAVKAEFHRKVLRFDDF